MYVDLPRLPLCRGEEPTSEDRLPFGGGWVVAFAFGVAIWFGPVRESLLLGQINIILMALVYFGLTTGKGTWWGGGLVGVAIAIKLTPAVFLMLLVLRRDWRGLIATTGAFVVSTAIGFLVAPNSSLTYWTQSLGDAGRIGGLAYASNQSLNAALVRLGLSGGTLSVAWLLSSLAAGIIVSLVAWKLTRRGEHEIAVVVMAFAALFCSPVSWGHHWVWGVLLVAVVLVRVFNAKPKSRVMITLAVSGCLVFVGTPHWWFPNQNDAEVQWNWFQQMLGNAYLLWGIAAVLVLGCLPGEVPCPVHDDTSTSVAEGDPKDLPGHLQDGATAGG